MRDKRIINKLYLDGHVSKVLMKDLRVNDTIFIVDWIDGEGKLLIDPDGNFLFRVSRTFPIQEGEDAKKVETYGLG